ncbi:hypothetical protein [Dactylosporangium sp. NPDC051484]|uniref:hypothetical protein n=1 Tax=Dactylosporangium sp. NPDC051484 TaxID=3154942 RepID=UPI00344DDA84
MRYRDAGAAVATSGIRLDPPTRNTPPTRPAPPQRSTMRAVASVMEDDLRDRVASQPEVLA